MVLEGINKYKVLYDRVQFTVSIDNNSLKSSKVINIFQVELQNFILLLSFIVLFQQSKILLQFQLFLNYNSYSLFQRD